MRQNRIAVALRYNREKDRAPIITSSGRGKFAEKIVALAREHGVPVETDPAINKLFIALPQSSLNIFLESSLCLLQ